MADTVEDGHTLWQQFADAGRMLDQPYIPPGFSSREVDAGGVGLPAWGVRQGANGPEFVALEV